MLDFDTEWTKNIHNYRDTAIKQSLASIAKSIAEGAVVSNPPVVLTEGDNILSSLKFIRETLTQPQFSLFTERELKITRRYFSILKGTGAHDKRVAALEEIVTSFSSTPDTDSCKFAALKKLQICKQALTEECTIARYENLTKAGNKSTEVIGVRNLSPDALKKLYDKVKGDIEESLRILYELPQLFTQEQSSLALVRTKFHKSYWFYPYPKPPEQLAIEMYIDAKKENFSSVQAVVKADFDSISVQPSNEFYTRFQENIRTLENDTLTHRHAFSQQADVHYCQEIKQTLAQLYPSKTQQDHYISVSNNMISRETLSKQIRSACGFWGTWSSEYKAAIKVLNTVDLVPLDKEEVFACVQELSAVTKSFSSDTVKATLLNQLRKNAAEMSADDKIESMIAQEECAKDEKKQIQIAASKYSSGQGFPTTVGSTQAHCDYFVEQILKQRSDSDIEKTTIVAKVGQLSKALALLFEDKKPNGYFVLLLLSAELARINNKHFPNEEAALKILITRLLNGDSYTESMKIFNASLGDSFYLKHALPETLELNAENLATLYDKINAIVPLAERQRWVSPQENDRLQDIDTFNKSDFLNYGVECATKIDTKNGLNFKSGLYNITYSEKVKVKDRPTHRVALLYALWSWYKTETEGGKEIFNESKHPETDAAWRGLRAQYSAILTQLKNVIDKKIDVSDMNLELPSEHPYTSTTTASTLLRMVGKPKDTSLDMLIRMTQDIFSTACVSVSVENSAHVVKSNYSISSLLSTFYSGNNTAGNASSHKVPNLSSK